MTDRARPLPPDLVAFVASGRRDGANRFVLRQVVIGAGESHVTSYDAAAWTEPRDLAAEVWTRAQRDAAAFGQMTTYFLCAFRGGEEAATYFDRYPFRVPAPMIDGHRPSEEPNAIGLIAQTMRHTEAMAHLYTEATTESLDTLRAANDGLRKLVGEQAETIARMSKGQLDVIELREKLLSQDHERVLETKRSEAEERRQEWAIGQLSEFVFPMIRAKLLPAAAAAATPPAPAKSVARPGAVDAAADPVAQAEAAVWEALSLFVSSFHEDKPSFGRVWNVLSEEQREILVRLIQATGARAQAMDDAKARAGGTNGAASHPPPPGGPSA